ncbi:MAG TPA: arsenate reductase family protein [Candidatus Scatomorpha merdigallinarum]|nr:arsenate reductase family protein [Candidatus Scatomorpha merdigallinarum]
MLFVCYPKCSTCGKARAWLEANGFGFTERDIKLDNPTAEELRAWHEKSGLPWKRFFNTSGQLYRSMGLSGKVDSMDEDEIVSLLASDGMLVKRPILVTDSAVLVGFREKEWTEKLL